MKPDVEMKVPFLDLQTHHAPLRGEFSRAIEEVIDAGRLCWRTFCGHLRRGVCKVLPGPKHAIGVGNGTDALWLALLACGIGQGDEVITVPSTFIATAEAISFVAPSRSLSISMSALTQWIRRRSRAR